MQPADGGSVTSQIAALSAGDLRPNSHAVIIGGVYTSLYVGTDVSHVHLKDVVVLGEPNLWGCLLTGRIITYPHVPVNLRRNTALTVERYTPEELLRMLTQG